MKNSSVRIKFLVFACLLSCPFNFLQAQNVVTDTSATVVAYWKKGEKKVYQLQKLMEKNSRGTRSLDSASFLVTISVLQESDTAYTIEWQYKTLSLPQIGGNSTPMLETFCNDLRVLFSTNETGTFLEVQNLDEILEMINKSFDALVPSQNVPTEMSAVLKDLKKTMSNRRAVEEVLLKDLQMFYSLYGGEFNSKKQEEEIELANIFGGDPFPAKMDFRFVGMEKNGKAINIHTNLAVDKKAATTILWEIINASARKMGEKEIALSEIPEVSINDKYRYTVDKDSGWMIVAKSERLVDVPGSYKREVTIYSMK